MFGTKIWQGATLLFSLAVVASTLADGYYYGPVGSVNLQPGSTDTLEAAAQRYRNLVPGNANKCVTYTTLPTDDPFSAPLWCSDVDCIAPYSYDFASNQCIKYCPPSAPALNSTTGQCVSPIDVLPPEQCTEGNPVIISSGEKIQRERPDYRGTGPLPLFFQHNYQARRAPEADPMFNLSLLYLQGRIDTLTRSVGSALTDWSRYIQPSNYQGLNVGHLHRDLLTREDAKGFLPVIPKAGHKQWRHNYEYRLVVNESGDSLTLIRPEGRSLEFTNVNGNFESNDLSNLTISATNGGGWIFRRRPRLAEVYSSNGQLIKLQLNATVYQMLRYNEDGLLERVSHSQGGAISFTYTNESLLHTVMFPDTSFLRYSYDSLRNIQYVEHVFPDLAGTSSVTNRQYHYEDVRHPYALTGITDERDIRFASWRYDDLGRVIESHHLDGVADRVNFDFNNSNSVTVTNALGKHTVYHYETSTGIQRLGSVEGVQTQHCAAANKNYTYYPNGLLETKTDWQGVLTHYRYNSRNQESSRAEAFGTAEERVITTEWHPEFNVRTKVIKPGRETIYIYDTEGHLLNQTVNALP